MAYENFKRIWLRIESIFPEPLKFLTKRVEEERKILAEKERRVLEEKLREMEEKRPSLRNVKNLGCVYKIGVNFRNNQPIYMTKQSFVSTEEDLFILKGITITDDGFSFHYVNKKYLSDIEKPVEQQSFKREYVSHGSVGISQLVNEYLIKEVEHSLKSYPVLDSLRLIRKKYKKILGDIFRYPLK